MRSSSIDPYRLLLLACSRRRRGVAWSVQRPFQETFFWGGDLQSGSTVREMTDCLFNAHLPTLCERIEMFKEEGGTEL